MSKKFLIYVILVLSTYAWANWNGYVYASFFSGQGTANKSANHYHK